MTDQGSSRGQIFGRALPYLIMANGLTAAVDAIAKHLSPELHSVQIVWGYFTGISVAFIILMILKGLRFQDIVRTENLRYQAIRSLMLGLTIAMLFIGIAHMPMTDAIAISFLSPLFVVLLASPMLGESLGLSRVFAVFLGLVGAMIVVQPSFGQTGWVLLAPLASAVFWALFQIYTRLLAVRDPPLTTLFYTAFGGVAWMTLAVWVFWRPMSSGAIVWLAVSGAMGLVAHLAMIRAFRLAEASLLAPFTYIKLIWAAAIAWIAFSEIVTFSTGIGSLLIVLSGLFVVCAKHGDTSR